MYSPNPFNSTERSICLRFPLYLLVPFLVEESFFSLCMVIPFCFLFLTALALRIQTITSLMLNSVTSCFYSPIHLAASTALCFFPKQSWLSTFLVSKSLILLEEKKIHIHSLCLVFHRLLAPHSHSPRPRARLGFYQLLHSPFVKTKRPWFLWRYPLGVFC